MANPNVEVQAQELSEREVFVGPRPFERSEQNLFFGRDREISELLSLVTSNRVVLCYAPSGAGKTSLINAGLHPRLEREGFEVLPSTRVRGLIPDGVDQNSVVNIYIFNAILSLSKETGDLEELAQCTLAQYLSTVPHLTDEEDFPSPRILIFDQFEELLTSYLERWQERDGFFQQVHDALQQDPLLRVLFVMREDYVARIEPFMRFLKPLQQTRFRLDLLGPSGAQAAVTGPLRDTQRRFKDGVVDALIEELRKVRVESTQGDVTEVIGEYVEPVQLQVVCRNLWNSLPADVQEISHEHLKAYGDVNHALRDFYESCITNAKTSLHARERALREWFEHQLITPAGTRGIVFRDAQQTAGLPNAVVDLLENKHVIRGEWRAGSRWYELTHDRLIEPIQRANEGWRRARLARTSRVFTFAGGVAALLLILLAGYFSFRTGTSYAVPTDSTLVAAATSGYENATLAVEAQSTTVAIQSTSVAVQADASLSKSRQLAAEALLTNDRNLSLLLAIEANRSSDTIEARKSLHQILSRQSYTDGNFLRAYRPQIISPRLIERLNNRERKWVLSLAFSPDGQRFVSAGQDTLLLWDTALAKEPKTLSTENMSNTQSVAFSPDGSLIFSANSSGQILVWDTLRGELLGPPLTGHVGLVRSLALSADGKWLASGDSNGTILIWDLAAGSRPELFKELMTTHQDVWSLAWSPNGKYLASAGADSILQLWDTESFREFRSLKGHSGLVWSISWSPDNQYLASASGTSDLTDGQIILWKVDSGDLVARPPVFNNVQTARRVMFDPSGKILVICRDDGYIVFWDVTTQSLSGTLKAHTNRAMSLAFSPDGRYMISGGIDGTIALWNLLAPTNSIAVNPEVDLLATSQGSIISLWDITTNEVDPTLILSGHTDTVLALAFSPSGQTLASSGKDNLILFWDVKTGQQVGAIRTLSNVQTLQFSPDGTTIAAGGDSGRAQISNPLTGQVLYPLVDQASPLLKVQYSQNGNTLIVAGNNGRLTTFDLQSGEPSLMQESMLPSAQDGITSIALSPDGNRAAYFRTGGTGETAVLSNDGRAHGIELSYWDQSFDPAAHPDDVDFVLVKATEGTQYVDPNLDKYLKQINSVPLRGTYHYFKDNQPWQAQADLFLSNVKDKGFHFYVLYLETPSKGSGSQFLTDAEQWLQYVENQVNGRVLIGASSAFLSEFGSSVKWMHERPLLVAQYPTEPNRDGDPVLPRGFTEWRIWNYTDNGDNTEFGTGAPGAVLDVFNGTPQDMGEWLGLNAFSILDRSTGTIIHPNIAVEINGTNSFAFSPDSTYLAAAGDGRVFLLNAATGEEISTLNIGGRTVYSLSFLPDSDRLVIGTDDGTVLLWDLSLLRSADTIDAMVDIACSQVQQNFTPTEWIQYYGPDTAYESTCPNAPVP